MKIKKEYVVVVLLIIFLSYLVLKSSSVFGISSDNLEKDARESQKIDSAWDVSKSVNKNIGAMIFYKESRDDYIFSIYLNHSGFSYGYFFDSGGSIGEISDGIKKLSYGEKGSVLISMNKKEVARIELDNGIKVTIISIDSTKPFAEVIPSNCGRLTLFDVDGNEVPINE
jgi:hypothetical protein